MGYSSPYVKWGYTGYAASDDKLQEDTNIYSETTNVYVTKITGHSLTDMHPDSRLKFKVELRNTTSGGHVALKMFIDGVELWSITQTFVVWTAHDIILPVTWARGAKIDIRLRCPVAGLAEMKNFEICGKVTPMRLD
jgi:hypothetical protein